jgi:DNA-directed RNA polymerase subunit RPC12/RpoP
LAENKHVSDSTLFEYVCPNCGGKLVFDSALQKLKCPYCDSVFADIEAFNRRDELLQNGAQENIDWQSTNQTWSEGEAEDMCVYVCNSCGGEIICDTNTAATACPYCSSPVVMAGKLAGDLRPDYIIPFKLSKESAKAALYEHIKGKKLLPKPFRDANHIDEIKGLYVPFWLFEADSDVDASWEGTKVRHWSDSKYDYTETSYYSVYRRGRMGFCNVPVDGSLKIDNNLMESIEPFDFSQAVNFSSTYLSGYYADRYDVAESECETRANYRIGVTSEAMLKQTASEYDSLTSESRSVNIDKGITKYVLYPVWFLNTSWNGQNYHFAMNGQTGKMVGNLPMDKKEWWKWFFVYLGSAAAVTLGLFWLVWRFML